jgi:steroid delta-isomerase-like uncharacterized protein
METQYAEMKDEIKAFERRYIEEWNKGKAAAMSGADAMCAPNIVYHSGSGKDISGLKDYKQYWSAFYDAFPDSHTILDDMFVEGDKVAVRHTTTATHKGEFMGIPPTNKKITLRAIEIDRIAGGKLVESWLTYDTLGLMQQLGTEPTPKRLERE